MVLLQVVSDIDDTLMCSGGFWPAGRDTRYPKRCQYPGALALYSELDIGYNSKIQVSRCEGGGCTWRGCGVKGGVRGGIIRHCLRHGSSLDPLIILSWTFVCYNLAITTRQGSISSSYLAVSMTIVGTVAARLNKTCTFFSKGFVHQTVLRSQLRGLTQ